MSHFHVHPPNLLLIQSDEPFFFFFWKQKHAIQLIRKIGILVQVIGGTSSIQNKSWLIFLAKVMSFFSCIHQIQFIDERELIVGTWNHDERRRQKKQKLQKATHFKLGREIYFWYNLPCLVASKFVNLYQH